MSMVLGPPSRKRKIHARALAGALPAAVASNWNNRGKLSPASIPEAPRRRACRRVMPRWPTGTRMVTPLNLPRGTTALGLLADHDGLALLQVAREDLGHGPVAQAQLQLHPPDAAL